MSQHEQPFEFSAEPAAADSTDARSWTLLIVDDDPDVHAATTYALKGLPMLQRPLRFLHAHSAADAFALLQTQPDIAVILLDVVMESEDAGLKLVGRIRHELGNKLARIVLRTGQPGYAPEIEAISEYDINDYKTKSELTRTRLYTSVMTALRSYAQLLQLHQHQQGLETIVKATRKLIGVKGLGAFAEGVLTQLSSLFGDRCQGLVCVQRQRTLSDHAEVLAASGDYTRYYQQPLSALDNPELKALLETALSEQRTVEAPPHAVVFFHGDDGEEFAVYLGQALQHEPVGRELLQLFCQNMSICARNLHLLEQLRDSAYLDALLHIPNRTALLEMLSHGKSLECDTLVLIDLVQFAETNETFGYQYADQLLVAITERLRADFHHQAVLARTSGDVFALLGSHQDLTVERIQHLFAEPFDVNGEPHTAAICTGTVRLEPGVAQHASDLIKDASIALKIAKGKGPGTNVVFDAHLGVKTRERTRLLHQLRTAFESDRLFMMFQPQIDLQSGRPVAVEALMRWRADNGEFIRPDKFIAIAEHSGLIIPLGLWALHTALDLHNLVRQAGFGALRVAVNVSPVQLQTETFFADVSQALRQFAVPAAMLELEVTEGVALLGPERAIALLSQLQALGVSIALDDFGTGYSSLSYVQQLPLTRIKIDRAFISPMDHAHPSARLVDVVVDMGRTLGLAVLAEGVETAQQAQRLRELGCQEAQGYYFARPLARDDLLRWLATAPRG